MSRLRWPIYIVIHAVEANATGRAVVSQGFSQLLQETFVEQKVLSVKIKQIIFRQRISGHWLPGQLRLDKFQLDDDE